jgi:hypothetical protein
MIDYRFIMSRFVRYGIPIVAATLIVYDLGRAMIGSFSDGPVEREFTAFYLVGQTLNRHEAAKIYDLDFQNELARSLLPRATSALNLPYSHAPFEAVIYRIPALLSHEQAYRIWLAGSLALFCLGFALVWAALPSLPRGKWLTPLLLLLSFFPVLGGTLYPGQVAALPFFWMALTIYLERRECEVLSGAALAPCLAKPTLLLLLLPMLVAARRWRMLVGFGVGVVALAGVSLASVGWAGCAAYLRMLLMFGGFAGAKQSSLNTALYVDLNALFRLLVGRDGWPSLALAACVAAGMLPLLARVWLHAGRQPVWWNLAWATTLVWTMLLNVYTPLYDLVLVPLAALLTVDHFHQSQGRAPRACWLLLASLYVTALVFAPRTRNAPWPHVQTLVLLALGGYQLAIALAASKLRANASNAPPK